jgi:nitrate/nitrite-specific signal transduction histidine kinase
MKKFVSIRTKLITNTMMTIVAIFVAVLLVIISINVASVNKNITKTVATIKASILAKGKTLATNNSIALQGMAEDNAFTSIQTLVASTIADDEDVVYGIYMTSENVPYVYASADNPQGSPKSIEPLEDSISQWAASLEQLGHKQHTSYGGEVIEFAAPVSVDDEIVGFIRYGISTNSMRKSMQEAQADGRQSRLQTILVLLLIMVVALIISFYIFKTIATRITQPLQALTASSQHIAGGNYAVEIKPCSSDEIGNLATTFDDMRQTIKRYTEHLQDIINEKMQQVNDILNNIDQGLFTINLDGTVNEEYSKRANEILSVEDVAKCSLDELLRLDAEQRGNFHKWIDLVKEKHHNHRWNKLIRLAPVQNLELWSKPTDDERFVSISYNQIFDKSGKLAKIMILAKDETETRMRQKQMEEQRIRHENEVKVILGIANTPPEEVVEFMEDTTERLSSIKSTVTTLMQGVRAQRENHPSGETFTITKDDVDSLYRNIHTIKGNGGSYGFELLSSYAHQAEDYLEQLREPIHERREIVLTAMGEASDMMDAEISNIQEKIKLIFGKDEDVTIRIPESRVHHITDLCQKVEVESLSPPLPELVQECRMLSWKPLKSLMRKYQQIVLKSARRLHKNIEFQLDHELQMMPSNTLNDLDQILIHLLRNAVDHGVEEPEVREESGKGVGRIKVCYEQREQSRVLIIADDGKGIDTERLVEKALEKGLITAEQVEGMSEQDKFALMMHAGLSTAQAVTDISGRGVGMDAVQDKIRQLNATLSIQSTIGKGTTFTITIPVALKEAA